MAAVGRKKVRSGPLEMFPRPLLTLPNSSRVQRSKLPISWSPRTTRPPDCECGKKGSRMQNFSKTRQEQVVGESLGGAGWG